MSCREVCRRVFRGILVIPGCKTICYKCILPPCYSNCDSDDEKEDKDDEGYDSCGNAASESHIPEAAESSNAGNLPPPNLADGAHDYVNDVDYTNVNQVNIPSKSTENLYVQMKLETSEHLTLLSKNSPRTNQRQKGVVHIESPGTYDRNHAEEPSYVNTDKVFNSANMSFSNVNSCSLSEKLIRNDGNSDSETCDSRTKSEKEDNTDFIETKCEQSQLLSASDASVPSRRSTIDSPTNGQTLVLLETDL